MKVYHKIKNEIRCFENLIPLFCLLEKTNINSQKTINLISVLIHLKHF